MAADRIIGAEGLDALPGGSSFPGATAPGRGCAAPGTESLAPVVIIVRCVEMAAAAERAILVLKMRRSDHSKGTRRHRIEPGGLTVLGVLEGYRGLPGGVRRPPFG